MNKIMQTQLQIFVPVIAITLIVVTMKMLNFVLIKLCTTL